MSSLIIRKPFTVVDKVQIKCDPKEGKTKQSFKSDCDINMVIKKYQKSGILPGIREDGIYSENTSMDLFEAMQIGKSRGND